MNSELVTWKKPETKEASGFFCFLGRRDQFTIDYLVNLVSKTGKQVTLHLEEKKAA